MENIAQSSISLMCARKSHELLASHHISTENAYDILTNGIIRN